MRVLLTGVTGQIGSATCARFGGFGTVIAADRATLDLSEPAGLPARLDTLSPDVIINCAAYTAVDRAEDERDLAYLVNAEAPGVIAGWAAARAVPLVHLSTDYVFDGASEAPWAEDDPVGPLSVYGASKLAGERNIRDAGGPHLIVRTSWIYAAQGSNFLRTIWRRAREQEELRIVADQIGAPTPAGFVAEVLASVVERHLDDLAAAFAGAGSILHVAAAGATSWHGFGTAIVDGLRRRGLDLKVKRILPVLTRDYPTRAVRPLNSRLDLGRLRSRFLVSPPPWDQLLEAELDGVTAKGREIRH